MGGTPNSIVAQVDKYHSREESGGSFFPMETHMIIKSSATTNNSVSGVWYNS